MFESDYVQPDLLLQTPASPSHGEDKFQREAGHSLGEVAGDGVDDELLAVERSQDDGLLDPSSLDTVLDILAVMTFPEELALLETLTDVQKRQVWDATPDPIKQKLKQLRLSASQSLAKPLPPEKDVEQLLYKDSCVASPSHRSLEQEEAESRFINPTRSQQAIDATLGDWVVLKTHPKLTDNELIAIWEIVAIQADQVRIKAVAPHHYLGTRTYPAQWMVIYPKPPSA